MAEAKRQEPEMETTESYRGPVREVSNVERLYAPANDNKLKTRRRQTPAPGTGSRVPNVRFRRSALGRTAGVSPATEKIMNVVNAANATRSILWIVGVTYPAHLALALLYLVGLASLITIEESFLDVIDVFDIGAGMSELMFFVSMVILFLMGLLTLILATTIYFWRGVKVDTGISLILAAVCLVLYMVPVFNLIPWMLLWCLYVVKRQANE